MSNRETYVETLADLERGVCNGERSAAKARIAELEASETRLKAVLAMIVADNGHFAPGWSLPLDAHNYVCSYCGALAPRVLNERLSVRHNAECPIVVAQHLVRDLL